MGISRLRQRIQCCLVTRTFDEAASMVSALATAAGKPTSPRAAQCTVLAPFQLSAFHHAVLLLKALSHDSSSLDPEFSPVTGSQTYIPPDRRL